MNSSLLPYLDVPRFGKNWRWFLLWGIALMVLGILAISAATLTTLLTVVFLGFVISLGGIIVIFDTLTFWWGKWRGFLLHLLMGILYVAVGYLLIATPISASISLTLLLGILYFGLGLFRLFYSLALRTPQWGWIFVNAIISLLLGFLILIDWPASSLFIIGLFVGIDLFFCGWTYMMVALAARALLSPK